MPCLPIRSARAAGRWLQRPRLAHFPQCVAGERAEYAGWQAIDWDEGLGRDADGEGGVPSWLVWLEDGLLVGLWAALLLLSASAHSGALLAWLGLTAC